MMRIAHIKLRSIFQLLINRAHQIWVQNLLSNYFGALYLDEKTYPISLAKFSRRSLTYEAIFAFGFSISHSQRHAYSVYNSFLLLFCGSDSKSSVPYFFSFIHRSPSVVVISPSSSSQPDSRSKNVSIENENVAHTQYTPTYPCWSNPVCEYVCIWRHMYVHRKDRLFIRNAFEVILCVHLTF